MFETAAYAAAGGAPSGPSMIMQMAPLLLIFVVFYFLLIRPQQQRVKSHREMVENLRRGDHVITGGGMIGKIIRVQGEEVTVELGENVRVKVLKATITEVRAKTEPAPANDSDADDTTTKED